jgi:magnesium-transporting ATPase (P-type)
MATVHTIDGMQTLVVKGAPERVFPMCLDGETKEFFEQKALEMTNKGLRVLAFASKQHVEIDLKKDV